MIKETWHRKDDEEDRAYEAFKGYLTLGPDRNLEQYVALYSMDNNTDLSLWYIDLDWEERAKSYDTYVLQSISDESEEGLLFLRKKQRNLLESMRILADKSIKRMIVESTEEMTPYDVMRLIEISIKLENLMQNEPTEIIKNEGEIVNVTVENTVTIPEDMIEEIGRRLAVKDSEEGTEKDVTIDLTMRVKNNHKRRDTAND